MDLNCHRLNGSNADISIESLKHNHVFFHHVISHHIPMLHGFDGSTDGHEMWDIMGYVTNNMDYILVVHWIGLLGKILTGNPWVFSIKLIGLSG